MKRNIINISIIIGITLIFAIQGMAVNKDIEIVSKEKVSKATNDNEIVVWTHFPIDQRIEKFNEMYPDIKVKQEVFTYEEYTSKYLDALISGEVPDVMVIHSEHFGDFNSINGLDDLNSDIYDFAKYKKDFDKELLEVGKSLDSSKQLGIAYATSPIVTYYRKDIMEKYGFPSEPEELANYIESKENYLNIARTLAKDNIYLNQTPSELIHLINTSQPILNEKFEYQRNNDSVKEAMEISNTMRKESLIAYKSIWSEEGQEDIRNDKFAMIFLGSYGADQIKEWAPDQDGKWRVTRLPLGVYGWSNSTILSIPEKSKNKDGAWKFIEFISFLEDEGALTQSVYGYLPKRGIPSELELRNDYLGGQKDKAFYEDVLSKTEEFQPTPLDRIATESWNEIVTKELESNNDVDLMMENITNYINNKIITEKNSLIEGFNK